MIHELRRSESILTMDRMEEDDENMARGFSIFILSTTPINIAMVSLGLLYKEDCPLDDRIPRYLLFGGIAGLTIVLLRLSLVVSFRKLDSTKEHKTHAGMNMARSVMYLFILFIFIWNLYGSYLLFSSSPELEDTASSQYCKAIIIKFSYVWFTIFDIATLTALFLWMASLIAACLHPDFLIIRGIRPPSFLMRKYSETSCLCDDPEIGGLVPNKKIFVVDQVADSPRQYKKNPSVESNNGSHHQLSPSTPTSSSTGTANRKIQRRMSNRPPESRRGSCVSTVIITSPQRANESESKKVFSLSPVDDDPMLREG